MYKIFFHLLLIFFCIFKREMFYKRPNQVAKLIMDMFNFKIANNFSIKLVVNLLQTYILFANLWDKNI